MTPDEIYRITGTSPPASDDYYTSAWVAPGMVVPASLEKPHIKKVWDYRNIAMISWHARMGCCEQEGVRTNMDFRDLTKRDRANAAPGSKPFRLLLVAASAPHATHWGSDQVNVAINSDRTANVELQQYQNLIGQTSMQARKRIGQFGYQGRSCQGFFHPADLPGQKYPYLATRGLFLVQVPLFIQGRFPPKWWEVFDAELRSAVLSNPVLVKNPDDLAYSLP